MRRRNRQDAVKLLAPKVDVVIVVGSPTSSNSNRLRELAQRLGTNAYMVDSPDDLRAEWFEEKHSVGLTAGASAARHPVQPGDCAAARARCRRRTQHPGVAETVNFPLADGAGRQGDGCGVRPKKSSAPRAARAAAQPRDPHSAQRARMERDRLGRRCLRGRLLLGMIAAVAAAARSSAGSAAQARLERPRYMGQPQQRHGERAARPHRHQLSTLRSRCSRAPAARTRSGFAACAWFKLRTAA